MKPIKFNISVTITCDDGSGESTQTFTVPVTAPELQALQPKLEAPPTRLKVAEQVIRFVDTGDISEIRGMENHKELLKHHLFVQIYGMKGRTLLANKSQGVNKQYVGVLPDRLWSQEVIDSLNEVTARGEVINVVILDDGGKKPFIVHDILFVDKDWNSLGRVFNSLYNNAKKYEDK